MSNNPYKSLPSRQFWSNAVTNVPPFALDLRSSDNFTISSDDRVATAGSCFAQRVAAALRASQFNYYVTETAPAGMSHAQAQALQYGTYSARYGNLYYTRQFVQLFDRAYGIFEPELTAWERADGRFVDPFRPRIQPGGFASADEVRAARDAHFAAVRRLFETLDVLVITLGQTESWRWRADGAVLPLAPGVAGGTYDPALYAFVNVCVAEVIDDLNGFLDRLWRVNPSARVVMTVSPVAMVATYLDQHVMTSNCYSKSILRAAAGELCAARGDKIVYFPSYDLITSSANAGRYYDEDQRTINDAGVRHVMRQFLGTFATNRAEPAVHRALIDLQAEANCNAAVICDEEAITR
ncbi:GSCFA domain-containing protein [Methylobacterium sp. E-065]|uniref:GSCFA domain-containing protein n=1 Tax=Methylobacterium sp. E-065 TaxID=2836583 RepID=UPI001FB963A9|nr:GSCFA domain-containing protein [Methylobacterium sp. E-065]MCJ2020670.1 GSCFA domain-containing protein [Methylobacterium sp. E-065]